MLWTIVIISVLVLILLVYYWINKSKTLDQGLSKNLKSGELVVANVDLYKYAGLWYEISRLPNYFEQGCNNPTAIYNLNTNGTMNIINQCTNKNNSMVISGIAYPYYPELPATNQIGRLKVYFKNIPIPGEYNIIYLDSNYQYAMVGTTDRKSLWFLSRTNQVDVSQVKNMLLVAEIYGYPINKLISSSTRTKYSKPGQA